MRLCKTKLIPLLMLAAICLSIIPLEAQTAKAAPLDSATSFETCVAAGGTGAYCGNKFPVVNQNLENKRLQNLKDSGNASQAEKDKLAANRQAQEDARKQNPIDDIGCTQVAGVGNAIASCLSNLVYYVMVGVFGSLAYVCAFFFDLAVQLSLNSTTYALNFITSSWTIVRDLANMVFIFLLIYIALKVMLEAEEANMPKMLAVIVVVALLVNFSFFFSRVVIDIGNTLAVQFYNAIPGQSIAASASQSTSNAFSSPNGVVTNGTAPGSSLASNATYYASMGNTKDLTHTIMNGLQVQNILSSASFKKYTESNSGGASFMTILITLSTIYIAIGIVFGILAGAFLYAGAKFMIRIVGLWFVIIFSPLALVARAIPKGERLFELWWKNLVNFSIYPAAFLFMFFILTKFMDELNKPQTPGGQPGFINGLFAAAGSSGGYMDILTAIANVGIRLGFVIAMMYLALSSADIFAKYVFSAVDGKSSGWAKIGASWMGNAITGAAFGVTGRGIVRAGNFVSGGRLGGTGYTFDPRNSWLGRRTGVSSMLRGYEPTTKIPNANHGAIPIDWGGRPTKAQDRAKAREDRRKDRREDMLDRAAVEDEIGARRAQQAEQNPPRNDPPRGGGGGGGGGQRRVAAEPAQEQAQGQAAAQQGQGPQNRQVVPAAANAGQAPEVRISQADIAGSAAAQRALKSIQDEAKAKNAGAVQTLYLQQKGEQLKTPNPEFDKRVTELQQQGEEIKRLVKNQAETLRTTASQMAVVSALSKEPNMSRSSGTHLEAQRVDARYEMSSESLKRMKEMVTKVVRKEIPTLIPEPPPSAPAGGAVRPVSSVANDNNPPDDIKKAA